MKWSGYIGMYTAYLGGLDALVFTGGIGLNAVNFRKRVIDKLGFIQAKVDPACNQRGHQGKISSGDSGVEIWGIGNQRRADGCPWLYEGAERQVNAMRGMAYADNERNMAGACRFRERNGALGI